MSATVLSFTNFYCQGALKSYIFILYTCWLKICLLLFFFFNKSNQQKLKFFFLGCIVMLKNRDRLSISSLKKYIYSCANAVFPNLWVRTPRRGHWIIQRGHKMIEQASMNTQKILFCFLPISDLFLMDFCILLSQAN